MAPNDLKWSKMGQKWPKMAQKWHFDVWGTYLGPKSEKNAFRFLQLLTLRHRLRDICQKTIFWPRNGPKEVAKHSGKRSIGLPGIVSFLHVGKGSQGHVLDRSGPIWPTWNTPKKGFLSRKTPKNGVKMGWGHFHERVNRSPIRCGHFGANGSKISRFVSGRLKKKCWYKQICNGTYWLLLTGHFGPVFILPSQWSITAV